MEQKRFIAFIILSFVILLGWNAFVEPVLHPPRKPKEAAQQAGAEAPAPDDTDEPAEKPAVAEREGDDATAETDNASQVAKVAAVAGEDAAAEPPAAAALAPPQFEERSVTLGSLDFATGFRQQVTLTSRGAAVESVQLNDPRYVELTKPRPPLTIVGSDDARPFSLATTVPQLGDDDLTTLDWELVEVLPAAAPHEEAAFRLRVQELEIVKRFRLARVDQTASRPETPAYELGVELTFTNHQAKPRTVNYLLQGPTGLPLENVDNTQKYRDVVVGFLGERGDINHQLLAGKTIAGGDAEEWHKPFAYLGVDVQYFAALLLPTADQRETPYTRSVKQMVVGVNRQERSDVSVLLESVELDLKGQGHKEGLDSVTHAYRLYAGPKREDVLPAGTEAVIDYGWLKYISQAMLALLKVFHTVFGNWGIAIIGLTVVVRGALFPLSIKQARGAAKMQELQPEIAALKEKYGKDKEKMARAQMELFSKHNYNPLAGCLPILLQLPIFMGLYNSLNIAVDLRLAKFLWIQNLAAPDALFQFGFALPILGWKEFNLLPLITIALFLVQQKMFMPPPMNDEQAMQQKMMNFMMVFMGVMFYKVPAGLCVYFIASSLWGLAERKLLPKVTPKKSLASAVEEPDGRDDDDRRDPPRRPSPQGNGDGQRDEPDGFFTRLLKAADKQTSIRRATHERRR